MSTAKTVAKDDRDIPEDARRPAAGVTGSPVGRRDFKAAVILGDDTATRIRVVLFGREATDGDPVTWVRRGLPVTGVARLQKKLRVRESDLLSFTWTMTASHIAAPCMETTPDHSVSMMVNGSQDRGFRRRRKRSKPSF
ncbi:hypothetical protein [Thiocapsa marina]|uniref:hypothetical protein n=1 Tax=Thiocapsa marina TaxID=244573 RepID=UPI001112C5F4|nr:hypothetical protein [Thiocapsa marina]